MCVGRTFWLVRTQTVNPCFTIEDFRFLQGNFACLSNSLQEAGNPDLYSPQKGREIEVVSAKEIKSHFVFSIHYFWKKKKRKSKPSFITRALF